MADKPKFNPFTSVLTEGFTAEDATPPNVPFSRLVKAKKPKTIEYKEKSRK